MLESQDEPYIARARGRSDPESLVELAMRVGGCSFAPLDGIDAIAASAALVQYGAGTIVAQSMCNERRLFSANIQ